jgi:hypothetical protein
MAAKTVKLAAKTALERRLQSAKRALLAMTTMRSAIFSQREWAPRRVDST